MSGPSETGPMARFAFDAIGTGWQIETEGPLGPVLEADILERVDAFDRVYSRFRGDSLIARIAAADDGGRFSFPSEAAALFELYDRLHAATDGAVDPLVGLDLELLGYDAEYTLRPAPTASRQAHDRNRPYWSSDVAREGATLLTRRPLVIDLGAAGKGQLVDIVFGMLRHAGLEGFIVDGGGDLRHAGDTQLRVGLEHPFDPQLAIGVANLRDGALCASATNRRAWGDDLHHVLDARTGLPVRSIVATWVIADDAMTADGLATALFFVEANRLHGFRFEYVRMFADGRAEKSPDFDGELFA